jgi:hypothetical protein
MHIIGYSHDITDIENAAHKAAIADACRAS